MKQYTLHIPVQFNEGGLIPELSKQEFMDLALDLFGGYSYDERVIQGAWKSDTGVVYKERMTRLTIASDDIVEIRKFASHIAGAFKQECIYMVEQGDVEFIGG